MTDKIIIVGAGMAGLLAGNMLRRYPLQIVERQSDLPNNHHGVLRFRDTIVSEQTHIPFQRVRVFKGIDGDYTPIQASMLYAKKVVGKHALRSVISTDPVDRFIAPSDFIRKMADGLPIAYGVDGAALCDPERREGAGPLISTMPMPMLMDVLGYDGARPAFEFRPGWGAKLRIPNANVYATIYHPDPSTALYRSSITGDELNMEFVGELEQGHMEGAAKDALTEVMMAFGLRRGDVDASTLRVQSAQYAKMAELSEEDKRKARDFMFWATSQLNIFSLGRFAKWEHNLLMDDVVQDIFKIERWISSGGYQLQKEL